MCYSAQIQADYRKFVRTFGALMDIDEFARLFFERAEGISKAKIPKAMEDAFVAPETDAERQIKVLIDQFNRDQTTKLEQDLFKQRKRLVDAERSLLTKVTKAATESQRIATDKIAWARGKLDDIRRTEPKPRDSRIFPGHYAPVMVMENGHQTNAVSMPHRGQAGVVRRQVSWDLKPLLWESCCVCSGRLLLSERVFALQSALRNTFGPEHGKRRNALELGAVPAAMRVAFGFDYSGRIDWDRWTTLVPNDCGNDPSRASASRIPE
jgi:hypothetical protein